MTDPMGMAHEDHVLRHKDRVKITYKVHIGNATKMVELPFVMGVMADLSGDSKQEKKQKFFDIDIHKFNERMKAISPRLVANIKNSLTGEGSLPVDLTFESMDDFSPGAIVRKIAPLKALLDSRNNLSDLKANIGGVRDAEKLIEGALNAPDLLQALAGSGESAPSSGDSTASDGTADTSGDAVPEEPPKSGGTE